MSASPTYAELQAIMSLLDEINSKMQLMYSKAGASDAASAQRNMNELRISVNEAMLMVNGLFRILRRAGLPEDQVQAIAMLQRLITTLHSAYVALMTLSVASGGTVPMILAGMGVVTTLISVTGSYG